MVRVRVSNQKVTGTLKDLNFRSTVEAKFDWSIIDTVQFLQAGVQRPVMSITNSGKQGAFKDTTSSIRVKFHSGTSIVIFKNGNFNASGGKTISDDITKLRDMIGVKTHTVKTRSATLVAKVTGAIPTKIPASVATLKNGSKGRVLIRPAILRGNKFPMQFMPGSGTLMVLGADLDMKNTWFRTIDEIVDAMGGRIENTVSQEKTLKCKEGEYVRPSNPSGELKCFKVPKDKKRAKNTVIAYYRNAGVPIPTGVRTMFDIKPTNTSKKITKIKLRENAKKLGFVPTKHAITTNLQKMKTDGGAVDVGKRVAYLLKSEWKAFFKNKPWPAGSKYKYAVPSKLITNTAGLANFIDQKRDFKNTRRVKALYDANNNQLNECMKKAKVQLRYILELKGDIAAYSKIRKETMCKRILGSIPLRKRDYREFIKQRSIPVPEDKMSPILKILNEEGRYGDGKDGLVLDAYIRWLVRHNKV